MGSLTNRTFRAIKPYLPKTVPFGVHFCGLPGTGKTSLAQLTIVFLQERLRDLQHNGVVYVSSDNFRLTSFVGHPTYRSVESAALYRAMTETVNAWLECGYSVVGDATSTHTESRCEIQRAFETMACEWLQVVTVVEPAVARKRLEQRTALTKTSPTARFVAATRSQATWPVYNKMRGQMLNNPAFSDPTGDRGINLLIVHTDTNKVEFRRGR